MSDINKKYKKLANRYHPDKGGEKSKMQEITTAYKILKEYVNNYRFTFSKDEIVSQYPDAMLEKFRTGIHYDSKQVD